ncbi:MAG: hypothetical protein J6Z79_00480, partial [Clostridia bacterium]|nr:hypothetical protein [Clostridia bacterium]
MKKRFVSLLLVLIMLLPFVPAGVLAGAAEVKPEIYGTSLFLENNIAINFVVNAGAFEAAGFSQPQMSFAFEGTTRVTSDYVNKNGFWYFTFRDLTPTGMRKTVTATLSGVKEGERVYGDPVEESVASYCQRALEDNKISRYTKLKTLVADLLTYGAKCQAYFGVDTARPATGVLNAAQLKAATGTVPEPESCLETRYRTTDNPALFWTGASLNLADAVELQLFFNLADVSGVEIKILDEEDAVLAVFGENDFTQAEGHQCVRCDTLTPDRMEDKLYITAYRAGSPVSDTLRYSVASYAAGAIESKKDSNLNALLYAMLNYGATVKAYAEQNPLTPETPMTRARLDELTVATSAHSQEDLRQIVLDYFKLQSSFVWTSNEPIKYLLHYYNPDSVRKLDAGHLYTGIPYSSAGSCLQHFLDFYDEETGVFTNPYGEEMGSYLGNSCTGSIFWAWGRISTSINFSGSETMTPTTAHGLVKVGNYKINGSTASTTTIKNYSTTSTYDICEENGVDGISLAYAQALPGDAVVSFKTGVKNHAQIVREVKVVYTDGTEVLNPGAYDASKSIDPTKSRLYLYEQNSPLLDVELSDEQHVWDYGNTNLAPTFQRQWENGYLPVTCKEQAHSAGDRAAVAAATAGISGTFSEAYNVTEKGFGARNVTSNYAIARVIVTITDRTSGEVVKTIVKHVTGITRSYNLNEIRIELNDT